MMDDELGIESPYPPVETRDTRRVRRWNVAFKSDGPLEADLEAMGVCLAQCIQISRRSAFAGLDRDFDALAPTVQLQRFDERRFDVVVEYEPAGIIGDCEMMCLWTPIQVLNAIFNVANLQGKPREAWRPFL